MQTQSIAPDSWLVLIPVLLPLFGAALLLMLRGGNRLQLPVAVLVVLGVLAADLALVLRLMPGADGVLPAPIGMTMGNWLPPFGISFTVDLMGAGFASVAALVSAAVLLVAERTLSPRARRDGFHSLALLLLAGVSGAFLTGDLFNLYVWFEVMLVASFGLFALGREPVQLDGTVKYGFANFIATSIFLVALGLVYALTGTLNMVDLIAAAGRADSGPMLAIAALLLLAFGMKAAAFPVNAWLPASYHTPSPAISALLAALLTKVGIYALLRVALLFPAAFETLRPLIGGLALATLLLGALGAIAETGLRRALGFLLIGGIGASLSGLALGGAAGLHGAIAYALNSMLTMGALYLVAGEIEARTGTGDVTAMGGLGTRAPLLSVLTLVLLLSAAGVPPFLGFWPKLVLVEAGLRLWMATANPLALALWVGLLANAFLALVAVSRLYAFIFWRRGPEAGAGPGAAGLPVALMALAVCIFALGLWPEPLLGLARAAADGLTATSYGRAMP